MIRFYDTKTKGETSVASSTTIPSTDSRVSWWFQSLKNGVKVAYDEFGMPFRYSDNFTTPKVVNGEVVEGESVKDKKLRLLNDKINSIEPYIYNYYSAKKQGQDRSYEAYSKTVIIGITSQTDSPISTDLLSVEIMGVVLKIGAGNLLLVDYVNTKDASLQEHYEKLVKIGMRLKWTKSCIDEWKLSLAEDREPIYPIYPFLKKKGD